MSAEFAISHDHIEHVYADSLLESTDEKIQNPMRAPSGKKWATSMFADYVSLELHDAEIMDEMFKFGDEYYTIYKTK